MLPNPEPIISIFAQKWKIKPSDLLKTTRSSRSEVNARVEIARTLWNVGYNIDKIVRILRRDRTTILYYLGLRTKPFRNYKGVTVMAKRKLTDAQRAELGRLYQEGGYRASKQRSIELGVSPNYGAILAERAAHAAASRPKRGRPRKLSKQECKKWARAVAAGPINTGG